MSLYRENTFEAKNSFEGVCILCFFIDHYNYNRENLFVRNEILITNIFPCIFNYFPIDISHNALNQLEKELCKELPEISIKKKQGDYFTMLESLRESHNPKVIFFLGSNIGNMSDEQASKFIYKLGSNLGPNDKLFIGHTKPNKWRI